MKRVAYCALEILQTYPNVSLFIAVKRAQSETLIIDRQKLLNKTSNIPSQVTDFLNQHIKTTKS